MRAHLFVCCLMFLQVVVVKAQPIYSLSLEEVTLENAVGVHSYSMAVDGSKVLILGGRTDGLHKRRPFESFLESANNQQIIVLDLLAKTTYTTNLNQLSTTLFEQLQSTNQGFEQVGDYLYVLGGYGYSKSAANHITYSSLVKIEYKKVIDAVINKQDVTPYFSQVVDDRFAVTGGYLHHINDTFYLVGGQRFTGQYNPMGPDQGTGFNQKYTNEIRIFTLDNLGKINYYNTIRDTLNFHRRDYNVALQQFGNGKIGMTAFAGVFQYSSNIPWLNVIDIIGQQYHSVNGFEQKLNQYHSAHLSVYDSTNNEMSTFFFGGMAQFSYQNNVLVEDTDVPFVKTISVIVRNSKNELIEYKVGDMPGFLGSGAEFIPVENAGFTRSILQLDRLPEEKSLVGYIYGGIESDADNIFFTFDIDKISRATNKFYAVYLDKNPLSTEQVKPAEIMLTFELYPNPADGKINISLENDEEANVNIEVYSEDGMLVLSENASTNHFRLNLKKLSRGTYLVFVKKGEKQAGKVFWVR